jgi:chromosome segregation ATPase
MSDNELLVALSDMIDKKLSAQLKPIKNDIAGVKNEVTGIKDDIVGVENEITSLKNEIGGMKDEITGVKNEINDLRNDVQKINIVLENEIGPNIKLLAENYLPAAIRYEESTKEHEAMKSDIELLKKVVSEHSEKLQKIS